MRTRSFALTANTLATLALLFAPAFGQAPKEKAPAYAPPKTADGLPDIEGVWQPRAGGAAFSVLAHQGGFFLGADSKEGIVVGGVLPYQPWAEQEVKRLSAHMELDPTGKCHYEGVPHGMYFPFRIFVTPKYVAILTENMHARRIIYTDGSPHPKGVLAWMGDSRGHWEGSTLVVDVAGNNDKAVFDMAGHFHSDQLHVVERFIPVDKDTIDYEATFDDPKVFTRPFRMKFDLKRAKNNNDFFESDCFGGERDQQHLKEGLADLKEHYYK